MAKEKDILLDHEYDGIQELDNDLPPWWLWLFYITIAISVVYLGYYTFTDLGPSQAEEYMMEMNPNWKPVTEESGLIYHSPYYNPTGEVTPRVLEQFSEYIGPKLNSDILIVEAMRRADLQKLTKLQEAFPDLWEKFSSSGGTLLEQPATSAAPVVAADEPIIEALTSETDLAVGKSVYDKNCLSCHMVGGAGGIGPNFTDDYWIHGAGMNNMVRIINTGVPAKGMITWRGVLKEKEIQSVASYILTLHGTSPANPKVAQGEKAVYPLN